MAAADLYDACAELLGFAVACLGARAPVRRYVSPGLPAFDCPAVVVYWQAIQIPVTSPTSPPLQTAHKTQLPHLNHAALTLVVTRCTPNASQGQKAPRVGDLADSAKEIALDAWTLWNGIKRAHMRGTLFTAPTRELQIDPAIPISAQQGFGGTVISIQVELPGYDPGF